MTLAPPPAPEEGKGDARLGFAGAAHRAEQDAVREALGRFLNCPTQTGLAAIRENLAAFMGTERAVVAGADRPLGLTEAVERGHRALQSALNAVVWAEPGTFELGQRAHSLRHVFLAHIAVCNDALRHRT